MDGAGAAIKNSTDIAIIAAESIPNVPVCCAAVVPILNLVDVEICHYDSSHIYNIKEILAGSKTLLISCKKFGISLKMNSEDSKYTNAAFIIK